MKPDLYTKAVLTVIALALGMIACDRYVHPNTSAAAQGPFAGVQTMGFTDFFDTRTGEIYVYETRKGDGTSAPLPAKLRLTRLGEPLVDEYEKK
jgi:hypothetical protein